MMLIIIVIILWSTFQYKYQKCVGGDNEYLLVDLTAQSIGHSNALAHPQEQ